MISWPVCLGHGRFLVPDISSTDSRPFGNDHGSYQSLNRYAAFLGQFFQLRIDLIIERLDELWHLLRPFNLLIFSMRLYRALSADSVIAEPAFSFYILLILSLGY